MAASPKEVGQYPCASTRIMVLVDSDVDERQVPGLIEKHLEVITAGGGTVDNVDHWGR